MEHKRVLGTLDIFCIATGAMISSGLFVLPSIVYRQLGSGLLLAYFIAGLLMIPSMLAKAELATAMPRSGGTYFFIFRSLGPFLGTFAGFSSWLSISLKGAFALVGMGAFVQLFYPEVTLFQIKLIALGLVIFFLALNLRSVKESGRVQIVMVLALLGILFYYIVSGMITTPSYNVFGEKNGSWSDILDAAGMVFISFGGLTKVASLAGETRDPGKTLPRGMFLSFLVVMFVYLFSLYVTVGIVAPDVLVKSYTPLSLGGEMLAGLVGKYLLTAGAVFSFATTANASLMSASRIPLAMANDRLLPAVIGKEKNGIPYLSVFMTGFFMAAVILLLDLKSLVKVASAMMLVLFFMVNLSVILMRESRIVSYRPKYKAPLYPVLPILGLCFSIVLIASMGTFTQGMTLGFFIFSGLWYWWYGRSRNPASDSALFNIVERAISRDIKGNKLHEELTEILRERDNIEEDRFDSLIRNAVILDIAGKPDLEAVFSKLASAFAATLNISYDDALLKLHEREKDSTTVISPGLAIPHIILDQEEGFEIVIARVSEGVRFSEGHDDVHMIFSLAGGREERNFHLKSLMAIAQLVSNKNFKSDWKSVRDKEELRNLILISERSR